MAYQITIEHLYKVVHIKDKDNRMSTEKVIIPGFSVESKGFFITTHPTLKEAKEEKAWRLKTQHIYNK